MANSAFSGASLPETVTIPNAYYKGPLGALWALYPRKILESHLSSTHSVIMQLMFLS